MYATYTEGMEVTIVTRKTMNQDAFEHCLVTRVTKSCVWTGTRRWKHDGRPWGSSGGKQYFHSSRYAELTPREHGLKREQDHAAALEQAAYARRYRDLVNALLQHRPHCKSHRNGELPEIHTVALDLLEMLITGELP